MRGPVVVGILGVVAITLVAIAFFAALANAERIHRALLARRQGRRRVGPVPEHRPIEQVALDARRLGSEVRSIAPGLPRARREGIRAAYDDVLSECCACLEVSCELEDLPSGPDRDLERARVEHVLREAGLVLGAPPRDAA